MDDPFLLLYRKLWDVVQDHPDLGTYVKTKNQIEFDTTRRPVKETVASADLPELMLIPNSIVGNLHRTSSSTSFTITYQWVLTLGDLRVDTHLFPLQWILVSSMTRAMIDVLSLTWNSKEYVRRFDLTGNITGESQSQRQSNIKGWSTVQSVEAELYFTTSDLISVATP